MTVMNFQSIREAKAEAYDAGVNAFADFVQHAFQEAVKAAEQNKIAKLPPPSWDDLALKLARIGGFITFDGIVNIREENPYRLKPYIPAGVASTMREGKPKAAGGRPPKTTTAAANETYGDDNE